MGWFIVEFILYLFVYEFRGLCSICCVLVIVLGVGDIEVKRRNKFFDFIEFLI